MRKFFPLVLLFAMLASVSVKAAETYTRFLNNAPPSPTLTGTEVSPVTIGTTTYKTTTGAIAALAGAAQNPGGSTGQIQYNNGGVFGGLTAQGVLNNSNAAATGNAAYQVSPCQGFSDEQKFSAAQVASVALNLGAMTYPKGCVFDSQWKFASTGQNVNIFQFGGSGNEKNTANGGFVGPGYLSFQYYIPGILVNAPGQTAIDVNGDAQVTLNGVNAFPQTSAGQDPYAMSAFLSSSGGSGGCCNMDTVNLINSSLGGGNTIIGFPVDYDLNPVKNGGVKTGTITAAGSGYTNGTYTHVPLTGGTGTNVYAASVVVSGGAVTAVNLYLQGTRAAPGGGYVVNDVLSASNTNLGGTGTGFQYTVNTLYNRLTGTGPFPNMLPHFLNSFLSDESGAALASNFSDAQIGWNTFTGGQAIQAIFGGGANQIGNNKFEDDTNAVDLGGPNSSGDNGGSVISENVFTTNSFGGGFDLRMGGGNGYNANGNEIDSNFNTPVNPTTAAATASFVLGGTASLQMVNANNNLWRSQPATIGKLYCIDLLSGFAIDYINMQGNICNGTTIIGNVHYGQVPVHFVEDFVGPFGRHAEMGRPFSIGTSQPLTTAQAALEVHGTTSIAIPTGNTAQRPASPVEGMIRDNTTLGGPEAYVSGSWKAMVSSVTGGSLSYPILRNNSTTPNTVIDVTAGGGPDDSGQIQISTSGVTKTTGAFTAGSGNGCLDSGTVANSTQYNLFLISTGTTSDVLCSTSMINPILPVGYFFKTYVASFFTDSSANIKTFTQVADTVYPGAGQVLDVNGATIGTTAALQTLSVPVGIKVIPLCNYTFTNTGHSILLSSPDEPDQLPTDTIPYSAAPGFSGLDLSHTAGIVNANCPVMSTDTQAHIRARASTASTTLSVTTRGWTYIRNQRPIYEVLQTGTTSYTLRQTWNTAENFIMAWGEGGNGGTGGFGSGGGGSGCFAQKNNLGDAAGTVETLQIGSGGSGTTTQFKNGSTLVASFGANAAGQTPGAGCTTGSSTGDVKFAGAAGGAGGGFGGGGGAGGPGPNGAGAAGGGEGAGHAGGGGGAANGGNAGSASDGVGAGGNGGSLASFLGGLGATTTTAATPGVFGTGGGGGGYTFIAGAVGGIYPMFGTAFGPAGGPGGAANGAHPGTNGTGWADGGSAGSYNGGLGSVGAPGGVIVGWMPK